MMPSLFRFEMEVHLALVGICLWLRKIKLHWPRCWAKMIIATGLVKSTLLLFMRFEALFFLWFLQVFCQTVVKHKKPMMIIWRRHWLFRYPCLIRNNAILLAATSNCFMLYELLIILGPITIMWMWLSRVLRVAMNNDKGKRSWSWGRCKLNA